MVDTEKQVPASFYRTKLGAEPVRKLLKGLDKQDRKILGEDIKTVELGWPIGMPVCRSITSRKGLWEVRSSFSNRRIARILFCIAGGRMVLLHGFIKKEQKTPKSDLDLAIRRKREVTK